MTKREELIENLVISHFSEANNSIFEDIGRMLTLATGEDYLNPVNEAKATLVRHIVHLLCHYKVTINEYKKAYELFINNHKSHQASPNTFRMYLFEACCELVRVERENILRNVIDQNQE